ncbi:MAG: hypothetical protein ACOH19_02785 [Rhodoglobus sp.]
MLTPDIYEWRDHIILSREMPTPGERSAFYAAVRGGQFVALHRGIFVPARTWARLDVDARYRARILGAALAARENVLVSHDSAGALWRLPSVEGWPAKIHILENISERVGSNQVFSRHVLGGPLDATSIEGVRVTGLARTVVDIARTRPFGHAVAVTDAALRRTTHPHPHVPRTFLTLAELRAELDVVHLNQGATKARRVIDFASGHADRPGESLSRVAIHQLGLTPPELQVRLQGASGRWYNVDFWWPDFNHIGEFDGRSKYSDPRFLRGRTPEQALIDEKFREDDLRAASHGMSRWGWDVARSLPKLRALLIAAGIR